MPKDFKKAFLEEQNAKIKTELEMTNLRKELEELKKNQAFNQYQQQPQQPYGYGVPPPVEQQPTQFEADVRYIVGLCQRMSVVLRKCRNLMLPMSLGKEIDAVLREIDSL
jgi:hypothetical protein